jgi:Uncharacterized protein conserved in bacteria
MTQRKITEIKLVGIKLPHKTTNHGGKSGIDCGDLWKKFEEGNYADRIPNKSGNEIYAVYFDYEGDYTKPFGYFIGCKVTAGTDAPKDMHSLMIPEENCVAVQAKGKMPDCIARAWRDIWISNISRAYQYDFEVYDERSKDWDHATVEIFVSCRKD